MWGVSAGSEPGLGSHSRGPFRRELALPRGLQCGVVIFWLAELGALLVGRDSTALIELIKNAYDADAAEVVVYAHDRSIC